MYKRASGAEIAPCIISKLRYGFGGNYRPQNIKKCIMYCWDDAADVFGKVNKKSSEEIKKVKEKYNALILDFKLRA